MTDKKYKYWLAVVDGQTVQFSELAHMMATALHPEGGMDYAADRINLEDELKLAVRDGLLRVRNPAGLGFHTFPHGDALQRAVLIPHTDLEPFLNERSIELRITPHGNGPDYWTLENAAAAMQEQLNWHDGTRAEFQDQMQEAAQSGALVILNPRTCLPPIRTERVRTYWEYVTPASVNAWLANLKAPYRWSPAPPLVTVPHKSPRDFKPWETLVPFFEPINGVYMYQQAAREIADGEGWDDSKLAAFESEMANAVNDGSLPIRSRKTGMVISPDSLDALALVTVDDVNEWLESKRVPYRWKLKTQPQAAPVLTAGALGGVETDYSLLATPAALLDAFRQWGMKPAWFADLNSRKWLLDARKEKGQGQRGHVLEPLFCPYLVMDGLLNKVRKVNRLKPDAAWRTLEHKFPKVYTAFESHDPRDRTGD